MNKEDFVPQDSDLESVRAGYLFIADLSLDVPTDGPIAAEMQETFGSLHRLYRLLKDQKGD